ncbi:MAG TPA: hypothetical protein VE442_18295, partial [Jatrophihabitans sp.]|nr:hypothetical protein [Jatrophihabitans sp.]
MAATEQSASAETPTNIGDFGANEWLVEDMYERYLADPNSVDAAWHDFFADYRPGAGGNGRPVAGEQADAAESQATEPQATEPQASEPQAAE